MFRLMLLAGLGGFIGTSLRFLTNKLFLQFWKLPFPLATFTINILGCFIFGLITGLMQKNGVISPRVNAFLIVGFCGGFTTFSTFSFEALSLGFTGEALTSFFYIAVSVIAGLLATWLGLVITS